MSQSVALVFYLLSLIMASVLEDKDIPQQSSIAFSTQKEEHGPAAMVKNAYCIVTLMKVELDYNKIINGMAKSSTEDFVEGFTSYLT